MNIKNLNIIFIIVLIDTIENNYINDFSEEEISKKEKSLPDELVSINHNNLDNIFSHKNLFFSENNDKYNELNDLSDTSKKYRDIINNLSFAEIPENLISRYEDKYQLERRFKIIRALEKKQNININIQQNNNNDFKDDNNNYYKNIEDEGDEYFSDKHNFYGNKKLLNFDYHYYWYFLFSKKTIINNLEASHIKDVINTEPENIIVKQKICFPITKLFSIYNPDSEDNLLIKDIKCDLYQVKIFPYLPEDYNGVKQDSYSSISHYLPYNIFPQSKFVFQLLILPDLLGEIKGNLYIKFNDKNVLIIPITIAGIENEYKIKPLYNMNVQLNKQLSIPIKVINPDKKKILKIKDIIFSFNNNIRVELPNGIKIMNNISNINPSMLHVEPNDSTNILHLKYYTNKVGNEYGFIYLKINDDNNVVIPIIINVEHYELNLFPLFVNFGICEVKEYDRKNFIKVVPLLLLNYGNQDIEIKRVFLDYKDQFIHFHRIKEKDEESDKIIIPKNYHKKFGYLIFDGEYYTVKDKDYYRGKIKEGTVYIETNSTINQILGIDYFYMTDYNHVIKIKSGYVQNINTEESKQIFSIMMEYRPPKGFKSDLNLSNDKIEIYTDNFNSMKLSRHNKVLNYNIDLNIISDKFEKKYYYSPYILNDRLYTMFPFEINNNKINIAIFNNKLNNFSFISCINDKNICSLHTLKNNELKIYNFYYFGSISGEINRKEYMYVINNNLYPFYITQIKTNNEDFTIDLENYVSINKGGSMENYDLSLKGRLPNLIQKNLNKKENENDSEYYSSNINLIVYPKTAMLLSINIKSKNENESNTLNGEIYLYFNYTSKVILINQIRILMGDFSISPSNIKFGPGFLGVTQSQQIFCTNTYEFTLNIISVTSSDSRLIPKLLARKIKPGNKIAIIDILFDPGVNSSINRYKVELEMEKSLTYNELYLWKKSEEYWNDLGQNGKTEISADISVVTHFKTKIINVRSFIKKPNLVKKDEMDYGLMQVGHLVEKYIEGHNPTDSVLEMKLLLAPDYYNDVNDYSMYNKKEQKELFIEKNDIITILGCNFVLRLNNSYQTFFEYVIIKENIELENNFTKRLGKEEILKKIFYYGNEKVKKYVYNSIDILCHYEKINKEEILLSKDDINENFKKDIVSSEFNDEIEIIKNMTYNVDYKVKHQQNTYNIFTKFFSKIKNYISLKKDNLPNFQIHQAKQSFYLQENISQNVYRIQPHQNFTIGPIIFKPNHKGKVTTTLFLKNNLTILYPIKLKGEGGSGHLTFLNYIGEAKDKKSEIFNNNTNFIIDINRDTYENKMKFINNLTKTVTIYNNGNLPLIIKSLTVDGNECQTDDLKIVQCREFLIDVGETMDIDFEVTANFNNKITNRIVNFQTEFQAFELNIIIIISNDLYDQKKISFKFSKIIFFFILPTLVSIFISQKFFYSNKIKKRENSIINGGHIESANKIIALKENENKIKGEKKKGKNKKNKKNEIDKENNIIKNEKTAVINKSIKTVIKTNDNKRERSETKTFGVIYINKDRQNIKIEKEKNKKDISVINKTENKNNEKNEEIKEIKIEKKLENEFGKNIDEIKDKNKIENKNSNSDYNENIINDGNNLKDSNNELDIKNEVINKNINQLLNSNNNISNNINIKININLSSKSNNNIDSPEIKDHSEINKDKLIEANITQKKVENNNNYIYDIKINEELGKETNNVKISTKNKVPKKLQNIKKASTLKELLDGEPQKKKGIKKKSKKLEKEIKTIETKKEEEIAKVEEIKEDEKLIEEVKSNSNEILNRLGNEIENDNENDSDDNNQEEDDLDDFDFKLDIFNSNNKNEEKEKPEEEVENEEEIEDDDGYNIFNDPIFGSWYNNPFCTEEKKGDLDRLLKK